MGAAQPQDDHVDGGMVALLALLHGQGDKMSCGRRDGIGMPARTRGHMSHSWDAARERVCEGLVLGRKAWYFCSVSSFLGPAPCVQRMLIPGQSYHHHPRHLSFLKTCSHRIARGIPPA